MHGTHQLIARQVAPAGSWSGAPRDSVTLDYDARFRRRVKLACDGGGSVLLDLAEATALQDGDGLVLEEDSGIIVVRAAPESLVEIRCGDTHHLMRVAWHLGNRHLPVEIGPVYLRIRHDHVIVDMVEKLGARVRAVTAPFNPERGAYGHGRTHGHDHGMGRHDHGHQHHPHDHAAEVHEHD
jgi:urease accessory protein